MIMRDGITTLPPNQWIALELGGCASCTGSSPSFEHTIEVISIAVLKLLQPAEAALNQVNMTQMPPERRMDA
jgi:hypothetical protein